MPHMNNLDLAVFLKISKDHSILLQNLKLLQQNGTTRGYLLNSRVGVEEYGLDLHRQRLHLCYRIAQKVIDNAGTNTFLQTEDFHSGVRADSLAIDDGVQKKVRVIA
jgi:hypothetical protein